jgi:hypothetical protein
MLALVLLLTAFGCSATYIQAKVSGNPLDRVEQKAQDDWTIRRLNANTLEMSDAWPFHSIGIFGYTASHANLVYDDAASVLNIQYYLQSNHLLTIWMPTTMDAEPGLWGAMLKPTMNDQIRKILGWSGASVISRRGGEKSDRFAPPITTATPSAGLK